MARFIIVSHVKSGLFSGYEHVLGDVDRQAARTVFDQIPSAADGDVELVEEDPPRRRTVIARRCGPRCPHEHD